MPWRCRRPDRGSCFGLGSARAVKPLIPPGGLDAGLLASPFRVEQLMVLEAVVNRLLDSLDGKPIFAGHFLGREWLLANRFAVENLRPDSAIDEELPIVRASFGLQVFVFDAFGHEVCLNDCDARLLDF